MIDSASKRWAMLGFGRAGSTLPVPSGGFDAFDRMHFLGGYLQTAELGDPKFPGTATFARSRTGGTLRRPATGGTFRRRVIARYQLPAVSVVSWDACFPWSDVSPYGAGIPAIQP